jgi:hypothetical protein
MTSEELKEEKVSEGILFNENDDDCNLSSSQTTVSTLTLPTFSESEIKKPKLQPSEVEFNYKSPPAAIFLADLVRESDLTAARARVQQNKEHGTTVKDRLLAMKGKISAAKLTKCGTHTLGKDLLARVKLVNMERKKERRRRKRKSNCVRL